MFTSAPATTVTTSSSGATTRARMLAPSHCPIRSFTNSWSVSWCRRFCISESTRLRSRIPMMRDRRLVLSQTQERLHQDTDQLFVKLLIGQWLGASILALVVAPELLVVTVVAGALVNMIPLYLVRTHSGRPVTRHAIAVVQMLWCTMLIAITQNRVETQFHVFGSIAFLAFYRDWKVLPTALLTRLVTL